jgi:FHS family glucose/mannose:H+ symporter-like MFS transporter
MYKRTHVFAAACAGIFLFGMVLIVYGSIMPALTEKFAPLGFDAGIPASILPAGILAGALVFGPVVDRYGYKLLLIFSILICAAAVAGLAFTESLSLLYLCIFFAGFGGGIINGGTSSLVADISSENKGANLSLLGVFFGIGALGLPLLLGVLSKQFTYSAILGAVSVFMLLTVIYFIATKFPLPKHTQGFPLKAGIKLLKEPALLLTSFFLFFQSAAELLTSNWTTSFLQAKLKIDNEDALYALSFNVAGLTVARLLLGWLLKKTSSFTIQLFSLLTVICGFLLLMYSDSYVIAIAALVIIGAGLAAGFPVVLGYIGQLYTNLSGTAFSIAFTIALAGNTLLNYIFGIIAKKYSITYLPLMILGCAACMIILLFLIKRNIASKVKL